MGYKSHTMRYNVLAEANRPKPIVVPLEKHEEDNKVVPETVVIQRYAESDRIPVKRNIRTIFSKYKKVVTDVLRSNQWEGNRCFVIGGGESLKDFDFSLLKNEFTIGTNRSFQFYEPTVMYSMDTRFHAWVINKNLDDFDKSDVLHRWEELKCVKLFLCPMSEYDFGDNIYVVNRLLDVSVSRDLELGIYGGNNSGFGALMLAIALGANPIYLLGFDMKAEKRTHFHSGYPGQKIENLRDKLESYRKLLHDVEPAITNMGIKVVNLNPDSGVTCFEFDTIENVIKKNKEV